MEIFKPLKVFCSGANTKVTVNVRGGKLVDNAYAYTELACPGCERWTDDEISEEDDKIEREWGPEHVHQGRHNSLDIRLVDKSRFRGGDREIVVGQCSPVKIIKP